MQKKAYIFELTLIIEQFEKIVEQWYRSLRQEIEDYKENSFPEIGKKIEELNEVINDLLALGGKRLGLAKWFLSWKWFKLLVEKAIMSQGYYEKTINQKQKGDYQIYCIQTKLSDVDGADTFLTSNKERFGLLFEDFHNFELARQQVEQLSDRIDQLSIDDEDEEEGESDNEDKEKQKGFLSSFF